VRRVEASAIGPGGTTPSARHSALWDSLPQRHRLDRRIPAESRHQKAPRCAPRSRCRNGLEPDLDARVPGSGTAASTVAGAPASTAAATAPTPTTDAAARKRIRHSTFR
jgi:hypothetical protein